MLLHRAAQAGAPGSSRGGFSLLPRGLWILENGKVNHPPTVDFDLHDAIAAGAVTGVIGVLGAVHRAQARPGQVARADVQLVRTPQTLQDVGGGEGGQWVGPCTKKQRESAVGDIETKAVTTLFKRNKSGTPIMGGRRTSSTSSYIARHVNPE